VGRERARRAEHLHASVSGVDSGPSLWGACARAVLSTCMQADLRPDRNGRSRSQSQSRGQIVTVSRGRAVGASRRQSESESLNPNLNPNLNLNLNLNLNHNLNLEARSYPPLEAEQLAQQLDQRVLGQVADLMRDATISAPGSRGPSGVIRRHQASSGVIGRHRASSGVIGRTWHRSSEKQTIMVTYLWG
jgi:hypothetical protein